MKYKWEKVRFFAALYTSLPLALFICGYLRIYYAIFLLTFFFTAFAKAYGKNKCVYEEEIELSKGEIFALCWISLGWTYLGGMNGYFYQSSDWSYRNAVYFDLIKYDWPVVYNNGTALVYYIGHWLPPAAVAKFVLRLSGSVTIGLMAGRMLLWVWSSLGIFIIMLILFQCCHTVQKKMRMTVIVILIMFSGLDIIGVLQSGKFFQSISYDVMHLEGWHKYQFTSITACLFWVFNQSIIPWILTLLFMLDRSPDNYMLYIAECFICGPFPAVGLLICMVIKVCAGLLSAYRKRESLIFLKRIFSLQNILSLVMIFPIALYFMSNAAVAATPDILSEVSRTTIIDKIIELLVFLLLEVGIYMILIYRDHIKDPVFYAIAVCFSVSPCIHIGLSNDFCMRATIPAIFILMVYVSDFILKTNVSIINGAAVPFSRKMASAILYMCLLFGSATPLMEFTRGIYHVAIDKSFRLERIEPGTLVGESEHVNFICKDPEKELFFNIFADNR